ncbi:pheromone receptor [Lentinula raphanica]|nr:pheromone receptor [Lentinula raphanica]
MPSSDPTFPLFSIFAFVGFVLTVIPLPWHFQAWNSGTCAFMLWVGSFCLVLFINSLIWADNALNTIPVWCDISSQILAGAGVGIPASTLCITRRLYRLTSTQTVSITRDDKMRAIYEDIAIAAGLPIFVLILHIIVQPHRFDIIEEYGCSIATYNTIPSYFLFYMWPVLLGSVSFIYSSLTLRTFYMRRIQFNQILSANTAINPSRYIRLMLLALIDIMCTIPLGIYVIYLELHGVPLQPWISWDDTHFDFGRVVLVPAVVWRSSSSSIATVQINRWLPVACAFVFFALFGFAEEAMKNYRRSFWYVAKLFGFHPRPGSQSNTVHQSKSGMFSGYVILLQSCL